MSESARVTAIDAIDDFRKALCIFREEALEALSAAAMGIRRDEDWLEDQLKYWRHEIRRCEEQVTQAKLELSQRKIYRAGERVPDCTVQEKALRMARARLEDAEEKAESCR